ncbi:hypothetical protein ST201phi2-1p208 [Pseudomonas phage 201phi2-1]|uniref:Lipoprotein n=1 Tax=Pseudomonas phage 201phi2-1 TaxID=198110 RepID=B3FJ70_BP201|nr:hypothetical protein ST201phi2-1p208 [Pseudomonas phage 201phi2-1]ABY63037.1 hypothetical protein 201phi2-1p208 [Pseudomonas phage 201phi2-1]
MRLKILAVLSVVLLAGCNKEPDQVIGTLMASRCDVECGVVINSKGIANDDVLREFKTCGGDNKDLIGRKVIAFKQNLVHGETCMTVYEYLQR